MYKRWEQELISLQMEQQEELKLIMNEELNREWSQVNANIWVNHKNIFFSSFFIRFKRK